MGPSDTVDGIKCVTRPVPVRVTRDQRGREQGGRAGPAGVGEPGRQGQRRGRASAPTPPPKGNDTRRPGRQTPARNHGTHGGHTTDRAGGRARRRERSHRHRARSGKAPRATRWTRACLTRGEGQSGSAPEQRA